MGWVEAGLVEPQSPVPLEEAEVAVSLVTSQDLLGKAVRGSAGLVSGRSQRPQVLNSQEPCGCSGEKAAWNPDSLWTWLPNGLPDQILGCPWGFLI